MRESSGISSAIIITPILLDFRKSQLKCYKHRDGEHCRSSVKLEREAKANVQA